MRGGLRFLGGMTLVAVVFPSNAWAYLDAGTGSFILQMLLGGVAGMMVVGRLYWEKLKLAIARPFARKSSDEDNGKPQ